MRRSARIFLLLTILFTFSTVAFFARYQIFAFRLEESMGFDGIQANTVKHAYAAAQVYSVINRILGDETSEAIVIFLGKTNEYAEQLLKFRNPDPTHEIMKDLYNNQAGITTAQWHKQHKNDAMLKSIVTMTKEKLLVTTVEAFPTHDEETNPRDIDAALQWFSQERPAIIARVTDRLSKN